MILRALSSLACALVAAGAGATLPAPERVSFPSLEAGVTVPALLYRPAAPAGPWPVIVALHGCGGMYSARADRRHELSARHAAWTERFLAAGFAVLWPDSFAPRGRQSVCAIKRGEPSIDPVVRKLDVLGAMAFAAHEPGLDGRRLSLVGWSHGGSTVLETVNGEDARVSGFYALAGAPPPPRAAVAFYPGCGVATRMRQGWLPAVPLAVYAGALDDWTASDVCVRLGEAARARGADMSVTVYPDAHHGFDGPGTRVTHLSDVTRGVRADKGVTVGPHPAARAAVEVAVPAFLRLHLKGS